MFVPSAFRPVDDAPLVQLIRAAPLATLVSTGPDGPLATHLPVVLESDARGAKPAELVGSTVLGHLNRRNPHFAALSANPSALLIFTGPHGYVSPAVHGSVPAAPTWNFTAVHLRGRAVPVQSDEDTLWVVRSTARLLEERLGRGWDAGPSLGYFDRLLPGVGAFRLVVAEAAGMFKLSQDQPESVRDLVAEAFGTSPVSTHQELARLMRRLAPTASDRWGESS
jgi:transcriptional regulator